MASIHTERWKYVHMALGKEGIIIECSTIKLNWIQRMMLLYKVFNLREIVDLHVVSYIHGRSSEALSHISMILSTLYSNTLHYVKL